MIELGLTKKEAELVSSALSRMANALENEYRYKSRNKEDDKDSKILFNIMERIRLQKDDDEWGR